MPRRRKKSFSAKQIAAAKHNCELDALTMGRFNLVAIMLQNFWFDSNPSFASKRFAAEFKQEGRQLVVSCHLSSHFSCKVHFFDFDSFAHFVTNE